jgi:hypothetical protein
MHCAPKAVQERLRSFCHVKPLPSERIIARILARHGLTHSRSKGIFVGPQSDTRDDDMRTALGGEPYIVQSFIPKQLWAEEYPWIDRQNKTLTLKQWQTDFMMPVMSPLKLAITFIEGINTNSILIQSSRKLSKLRASRRTKKVGTRDVNF